MHVEMQNVPITAMYVQLFIPSIASGFVLEV